MTDDLFDRLEADLAGLAHAGAHLDVIGGDHRRRVTMLARRGAMILVLAVALATSLVSEFPASAGGRALPVTPVVRGL